MIESLRLEPMLPVWLLCVAGVAALWMAWRAWRGAGILGGLLRAAAALALVGALAGPARIATTNAPGRPALTLLVDTSRSMSVCDQPSAGGAIERFEAIRPWLAPALLERAGDEADLRIVTFDADTRPASAATVRDAPADGEATDLTGALERAINASPEGAGVLVFTDGADSMGAALDAVEAGAVASGVRIGAVVPGAAGDLRDASVTLEIDRSIVLSGGRVELTARMRASGFDAAVASLTIVERLGPGEDRVLLERRIDLGAPKEIRIDATPPALRPGGVGSVEYIATLTAGPGDADPTNNEARAVVQVGDAPIRVLVFEARPSWETRFFLDAIRADPRIEATSVSVLGGRDRVLVSSPAGAPPEPIAAPPTSAAALARFDVIALGRGVERWFPGARADDLARFVEEGGGLIFLRGDPVGDDALARECLGAVSPVAWGTERLPGGRLFATIEGRTESPVGAAAEAGSDPYLQTMPGALATTLNEGERTLSTVWLRSEVTGAGGGERAPAAIAHLQAGRGGALAVLTDGLWRWAFAPPSREDARRAYAAFWAQAVRVLAGGADLPPGAELQVVADPPTVRPGEPVRVTVRARPGSVGSGPIDLTLVDSDGGAIALEPARLGASDRWTATVSPERPGTWRIVARASALDAEADALIAVRAFDAELAASRARPDAMRSLAEATGGRLLPIDAPEELLWFASEGAPAGAAIASTESLWRHPGVLGLIAFALLAEWARRRLGGGV
jgi:hypothetical protein